MLPAGVLSEATGRAWPQDFLCMAIRRNDHIVEVIHSGAVQSQFELGGVGIVPVGDAVFVMHFYVVEAGVQVYRGRWPSDGGAACFR